MTWPPVDLCCSESSEDMSSPSGASSTSTLSSSSQQTIRSCAEPYVTASPQLFTDYMIVREELEYLLLREDQGPQPFNYIPFHTFMSHEHREFLVQSINNAAYGQGYELTTAALAVSILDRFAATQYIQRCDAGVMPLAAIACLSLAAKLEEVGMPADIHALQAHTPWLGPANATDIARMEMLIMRAIGWRLGCLTAASFLDQLLADALSGALFHLQAQSPEYLSTARQLAAKLLAYTMPGEFNLQFAASTQACAAVVVAFQAVKVNQQALMCLIEEWTQLGIPQVLACVNMLLGLVDYLPMGHDSRPGTSCTSTQSAHSTSEHQSSPFSSASQHADGSSPDPTQSPLQLQSTQRMAASPLPAYCPLLETATSLSSVNTTS
ncbi:hypothetical protein ABBQ32_006097 [Trebouxia sp. C0010 RCD-2024]